MYDYIGIYLQTGIENILFFLKRTSFKDFRAWSKNIWSKIYYITLCLKHFLLRFVPIIKRISILIPEVQIWIFALAVFTDGPTDGDVFPVLQCLKSFVFKNLDMWKLFECT